MDAVDIIRTKRDAGTLTGEQIEWIIAHYTGGDVPDYQMSALLMAIFHNGMDPDELARWTQAMIASGTRLDLSRVGRPTVDKHSTGGVGDKLSLIVCPLLAACGAAVPQLSGRGLGHTGGTLDKMESIPGWRADLGGDEFERILAEVGAVICAAGADLAPADKLLYALRDVTATVESIPLISSSIMSKKIAEGTDALVLDVKVGSGAFMKDLASAQELARTMVGLGKAHGVRTAAVLTAMDEPIGLTAGNALEVREAVEVLAGGGPADVVEISLALAATMADLAGVDADVSRLLAGGAAMDVWRRMVAAQGGDPEAALPTARVVEEFSADQAGVLSKVDAYDIGVAAWKLGAGRARKEDPVSAGAGVELLVKPGAAVQAGQPLLRLHTDDESTLPEATELVRRAIVIGETAPPAASPILGLIS